MLDSNWLSNQISPNSACTPRYGKPRSYPGREVFPEQSAPRGCFEEVIRVFKDHGVKTEIKMNEQQDSTIDVSFHAELRLNNKPSAQCSLTAKAY